MMLSAPQPQSATAPMQSTPAIVDARCRTPAEVAVWRAVDRLLQRGRTSIGSRELADAAGVSRRALSARRCPRTGALLPGILERLVQLGLLQIVGSQRVGNFPQPRPIFAIDYAALAAATYHLFTRPLTPDTPFVFFVVCLPLKPHTSHLSPATSHLPPITRLLTPDTPFVFFASFVPFVVCLLALKPAPPPPLPARRVNIPLPRIPNIAHPSLTILAIIIRSGHAAVCIGQCVDRVVRACTVRCCKGNHGGIPQRRVGYEGQSQRLHPPSVARRSSGNTPNIHQGGCSCVRLIIGCVRS
ncbi:MAG: hypothetical protein HC911_07460 [Chloroflexaceae bacterium]|nr:hypothetical protein [Chloroflexaceae bacterium]